MREFIYFKITSNIIFLIKVATNLITSNEYLYCYVKKKNIIVYFEFNIYNHINLSDFILSKYFKLILW